MVKIKIEGTIPVIFFKEDEMFIAHTNALDISTCGDTLQSAKRNFKEAIKIYFSETIKHGTLEQDLIKQGWKINPARLTIEPPIRKSKKTSLNIIERNDIAIPTFS